MILIEYYHRGRHCHNLSVFIFSLDDEGFGKGGGRRSLCHNARRHGPCHGPASIRVGPGRVGRAGRAGRAGSDRAGSTLRRRRRCGRYGRQGRYWRAGEMAEISEMSEILSEISEMAETGRGGVRTPRARRQIYDRRGTLDCFDVSAFLSPPPPLLLPRL